MSNIEGLDELNRTLKQLEMSTGRHSKSAYIAGGKLVEGDAKKSIQTKSGGETVKRSRNGGGSYDHVASLPDDAPNTDTGRLAASINTEPTKDAVYVGTSLEYGKHLEFGTKMMDERPWLIPALLRQKEEILALQVAAVNRAIKGAEDVV